MDPDFCLKQARAGFYGGSVKVDWNGHEIELTDKVFELASLPNAPVPPELALAVSYARLLGSFTPVDTLRLQQLADAGDKNAERAYHAHVFSRLCHMRRGAIRLMQRALAKDHEAQEAVEKIFAEALNQNSQLQKQAEISCYLLMSVMTEYKRERLAPSVEKPAESTTVASVGCKLPHPSDMVCEDCKGAAK